MKSLDTALSLLRPTPSAPLWQPGLQAVKINNVLTRSTNLSEMTDFVRLTEHHPISVRFIEFMPFSGNKWDKDEMVPYDEALGIIKAEFGSENVIQLRNEDGDGTSKRWKIKGWKGEIGFISSMVSLLSRNLHWSTGAYPLPFSERPLLRYMQSFEDYSGRES